MYTKPFEALCELSHETADARRRERSERLLGVLAEISLRRESALFEHARHLRVQDAIRGIGPAELRRRARP